MTKEQESKYKHESFSHEQNTLVHPDHSFEVTCMKTSKRFAAVSIHVGGKEITKFTNKNGNSPKQMAKELAELILEAVQ